MGAESWPLSDDARRMLENPDTPPWAEADALQECGWGETPETRALLDGLRDPDRGEFTLEAIAFRLFLSRVRAVKENWPE